MPGLYPNPCNESHLCRKSIAAAPAAAALTCRPADLAASGQRAGERGVPREAEGARAGAASARRADKQPSSRGSFGRPTRRGAGGRGGACGASGRPDAGWPSRIARARLPGRATRVCPLSAHLGLLRTNPYDEPTGGGGLGVFPIQLSQIRAEV